MSAITHQLKVGLDIELLSPLHIGGLREEGSEATLLPLEREGRDKERVLLRIPGSSLKGVLRTEVESLVTSVWGSDAACNVGKDTERHKMGNPCSVCSWFGYVPGTSNDLDKRVGLRSRFLIADALPIMEKSSVDGMVPEADWIIKKAQTPINRFHQIPLSLQVEAVPDRKQFRTLIKLENPKAWELTILAFLLRQWELHNLWLGGGNGRGLGRTKVQVTQLVLYDFANKELQWIAPKWAEQATSAWWGQVTCLSESNEIEEQLAYWGCWPLTQPGGEVV